MRRMIIIDNEQTESSDLTLTVAFWIDVPSTNITPNPNFKSVVSSASVSELSALQSGTMIEVVQTTGQLPAKMTNTEIQTYLQTMYTNLVSDQAKLAPSKKFIGASYDDATTSWTGMPS